MHQPDPHAAQAPALVRSLHPFGNDLDGKLLADPRDPAHNRLSRLALVNMAHQCHVELDDIGLKIGQQVQPCKPGAEVIDRRQKADALVLAQYLSQPFAVVNAFTLYRLENNTVYGEAMMTRSLERGADADLRAVNCIRHEIDRQLGLHRQRRSGFDRFHPAGLVKPVPVLFVNLR